MESVPRTPWTIIKNNLASLLQLQSSTWFLDQQWVTHKEEQLRHVLEFMHFPDFCIASSTYVIGLRTGPLCSPWAKSPYLHYTVLQSLLLFNCKNCHEKRN